MKYIFFSELLNMIRNGQTPAEVVFNGVTYWRTPGGYKSGAGAPLSADIFCNLDGPIIDRLACFPDFKIREVGELTEKERNYLEVMMEPFADRFLCLKKDRNTEGDYLVLQVCKFGQDEEDDPDVEDIEGPTFPRNTRYAALEVGRWYTAKELGLWL